MLVNIFHLWGFRTTWYDPLVTSHSPAACCVDLCFTFTLLLPDSSVTSLKTMNKIFCSSRRPRQLLLRLSCSELLKSAQSTVLFIVHSILCFLAFKTILFCKSKKVMDDLFSTASLHGHVFLFSNYEKQATSNVIMWINLWDVFAEG